MTKGGLALGTVSVPPSQAHGGMVTTSEVLWTQALKGRQMDKGISDCVLALWMMGAGEVTVSEERRGQNRNLPF